MSAHVRFYRHPVFQAEESKEKGRKVFKEMVYIEIRTSKNSSFSRPMREQDKYEHPEEYAAFRLEGGDEIDNGTPLKVIPASNSANQLELMEMNIRTVEALLEADESETQGIEGIDLLRRQARAYVSAMNAAEEPHGDSDDDEAPESDPVRDQLVKQYKELFGQAPHGQMRTDTMQTKINEKLKEAA